MLLLFAVANFLQLSLGANEYEDLTPTVCGDNSQSHAFGVRVGRTHGYYGRYGTTAATGKLDDANY